MTIFELEKVLGDPRFEGFGSNASPSFLGRDSITEDFMPEGIGADRRASDLGRVWKPIRVSGRVRRENDYPCMNLIVPVFSAKAVEALRDLLEPHGELLPLESPAGEYHAYHATTLLHALDRDASEVTWFDDAPSSGDIRAICVDTYVFHPDALGSAPIFRIPEDAATLLVTDEFRCRAESAGLRGLVFRPLWSDGAEAEAPPSEAGAAANPMAQSVHLYLESGADSSANVDAVLDRLDQLLVREMDQPHTGNVEGHERVGGAVRVVLSCPEAKRLAEVLARWLHDERPTERMRIVARRGSFDDLEAEEADFVVAPDPDGRGNGRWGDGTRSR